MGDVTSSIPDGTTDGAGPPVRPIRHAGHVSPPTRPDPALHARRAAQRHRVARRATGSSSCAARAAATRSTRCGCSTSHTGEERLVARSACAARRRPPTSDLPAEERARRERARERRRRHHELRHRHRGQGRRLRARRAAVRRRACSPDLARPLGSRRARCSIHDPTRLARRIAYVSGRLLCVGELDGTWRVLAGDDPSEPTRSSWGSADFVAAEEMHRFRGYWWSPDGTTIAACRVDTAPVDRVDDRRPGPPGSPGQHRPLSGRRHRQPDRDAASPRPQRLPHRRRLGRRVLPVPRIASTGPTPGCCILVQARDQRGTMTLKVDRDHRRDRGARPRLRRRVGRTRPRRAPSARRRRPACTAADRDGARRLLLDGEPVTPPDLQVRAVLSTPPQRPITFQANPIDDATSLHVWQRRRTGELVAAHRRARRAHRGRRRRHRPSCAPRRSTRPGSAPRSDRSTAGPHDHIVRRDPARRRRTCSSFDDRRATVLPSALLLPTRSRRRRAFPCCSTRTAVRMRSACHAVAATRSSPRSGSPIRDSP